MAEQNENEAIECHWVNWCRLCAKDDVLGNVKIDSSEKGTDWNSVLLMAIRKYFDVHMRPEDELSGVICKECYTLISELIDFAERVNKVQAIFEVLRHSEPNKMLDVKALRQQYALQDGDWTHIIKPVSDIDNNVSKQAVIAEEFPVEMLAPKQEFLNLSQEVEVEQPNLLDHCEEPIVTQLPTEEIFVDRCDAKNTTQNSSLKRPRGRPKKHSMNADKGDKTVSDLNEDLPNDSAKQQIPISDSAEPDVPRTSSIPDWTHMFTPVSDIDNNVSEQAVIAEEFPVEMLMPKQEFLNLSYEMEDEQPNPLEHCEEPIVSQLPTEEIFVDRCDAKDTTQNSSLKRPRGRPKKHSMNADKGDKTVSDLNEDLPNDSAKQQIPISDTAEPEVGERCDAKDTTQNSSLKRPRGRPKKYSKNTDKSDKSVNEEIPSKRRKSKCKWCSKLYHNPKSYEKHLRDGCRKVEPRPKVDKNTFCNICNKTLSSAAAFKLHMEGMHDNSKPFVCDHCGKQLKSLTALNEHKLVHTEDRPFKCTMCDACFKNKARLRIHYQTHEEPNYICNICGKKLQTRRTWNQHKLVHVEERRFKCDVCGALFKRSKTLKTHLLIHAGLRPYVCKYCGQTFSCNANCRAHKMKKHTKELMEEENEDFPNRISVPSLDELRVMSQILPNSLQLSKKG